MTVLNVTPYEIRQFFQILLVIALPLVFIALLSVTIVHYYRKRKSLRAALLGDGEYQPGESGYMAFIETGDMDSGPVYSSIFHENQVQGSIVDGKYKLLKHQFAGLYRKYVELLAKFNDSKSESGSDYVKTMESRLVEYESRIKNLQDELQNIKNSHMENINEANFRELFEQRETEVHQLHSLVCQLREDIDLEKEQNQALEAELTQLRHHLKELEASADATGQDAGQWNRSLQQQLYEAGKKYDSDKNEWMQQVQELCKESQILKEENQSLRARAEAYSSDAGEAGTGAASIHETMDKIDMLTRDLSKAEEERSQLRQRVLDLEYLEDVLQEKKLQVDFLQTQLEQRIKNYHQLEQAHQDDTHQLSVLKATLYSMERQVKQSEEVSMRLQNEMAQLHETFDKKHEEYQKLNEELRDRASYIEQLERKNQEWQEQHLHRLSILNNKDNEIAELGGQLNVQYQTIEELTNRLEQKNALLDSIHKELEKELHKDEDSPLGRSLNLEPEEKREIQPQNGNLPDMEYQHYSMAGL